MSDQKEPFSLNLNSKLALDERRSYSDPMKISPDGKFNIGINGRSNWCRYSGITQISPEASTRLFGKRAVIPVLPNNTRLESEPQNSNVGLSEAQDSNRLNGVPVFTIVNAKNEPLKGKDVGDSSPVVYFFLNPDDAIAQLNRIKNTNPEVGDKAKIIIRSMTDAYETIRKNQDRKVVTFQIIPSKASLDSAREILSSQGRSTDKLPDIPVFLAIGNTDGTDGLLTLTQNGKQFIPYFFDLKDLQTLVNKAMQAQPNVINITKMQVTSLSQVLDLIASTKKDKPNPDTERTFVPSRSAFEYVKQNGSSK